MIVNGKDQPIGSAAQFVPDTSNAIMNLMRPVVIAFMQKVNQNGRVQEIPVYTRTMATRQPFTARQLEIKPEGQRAWQWFRMHMLPDIVLKTDDRFEMDKKKYRVMRSSEYGEYGFYEYDIVQDYDAPS